jgi:hypothetical protein
LHFELERQAMSEETKGPSEDVSRRLVLRTTVVTLGAAATATNPKPASAIVKISKAAVAYQDHPQGDKRCEKCLHFQPPNGCKLVDGPIDPKGFCRIFTPLRQAGLAARPVFATG